MTLSVADPINPAIERARRVCFRPFDLGKWFIIGFCAFLAGFAEGGSSLPTNFNFNFPSPINPPDRPNRRPDEKDLGKEIDKPVPDEFREMIDWFQANLATIVVIGSIVLVLAIAVIALFAWLGSRGEFMFLENIVRNRGAVVAPWREYRKEGNSVFFFRLVFIPAVFVAYLIVIGGGIFIALPDIQAQKFESAAGTGLAVGIAGLLIVAIVTGVIALFLIDFVVPIMYLRRIGVLAAWREFYTSMLAGHVGTFVLYVLFKIVIAIAVGFLSIALMCCTLCIAVIPYVGTHVLMLPIHVFWRSYSLYFIEQFGPEWRIFSTADELAVEPIDEEDGWPDTRFRPGDEHIRPDDDSSHPPDDRFRPE